MKNGLVFNGTEYEIVEGETCDICELKTVCFKTLDGCIPNDLMYANGVVGSYVFKKVKDDEKRNNS